LTRTEDVTPYDTTELIPGGIQSEDFDIIPANQDLYCVNYHDSGDSALLKLSGRWLTNYVGDLLITQAGEVDNPPKLFIVHWDSTNSAFVTRSISLPSMFGGRFEHVAFAPIEFPGQ
jgi:hypothetical protein